MQDSEYLGLLRKRAKLVKLNGDMLDNGRKHSEFTTDQAMEWDKNDREITFLTASINELEAAMPPEFRAGNGPIAGGKQTYHGEGYSSSGEGVVPVATRALNPEESLHNYIRSRGRCDEELRDVRAGDVLRALATGARTEGERRALSAGLDTAGGYMVPSILSSQIIDAMRAKSVCMRAGARTLPLEGGEMKIAKVVTDPTPAWRGENTVVSEQEVVFGSLTLSPHVLAMVVKASRELLETAPNAGSLLESTFAKVMAVKVDEAALIGASDEAESWITGVSGTDGIHTVTFNSTPSWDMVLRMREQLTCANSEEPTALVLNPRDESCLARMRDGEGLPYPRPDALKSLKVLPTTSIPVVSTETVALLGDFTRLLFCPKVNLRIQLLNERYADYLQVGFLVWLMTDIALEEPQAFCKATGLAAIAE